MSKTQSLLKAAWIIAFVTVISKLIGFLRDVVIANYYGAGMVSDAYFYAYQIPALAIVLLGGIGGPFHSAVVSVFSKIIPDLDEKAPPVVNKLFILDSVRAGLRGGRFLCHKRIPALKSKRSSGKVG